MFSWLNFFCDNSKTKSSDNKQEADHPFDVLCKKIYSFHQGQGRVWETADYIQIQ